MTNFLNISTIVAYLIPVSALIFLIAVAVIMYNSEKEDKKTHKTKKA